MFRFSMPGLSGHAITFSIAVAAGFFGATAVHAGNQFDKQAVKSECSQQWGTEYDMVKFCIEERNAGFATYILLKNESPEMILPSFERCEQSWQNEWDMVAFCAREQVDAVKNTYQLLQTVPQEIGNEVVTRCIGEWPNEWDMVDYCATNRIKAWRDLQQ